MSANNGLARIVLRLHLGSPYLYQRKDDRGNVLWEARYAPICTALHARVGQDVVVYVGLDGPDQGEHFVCGLDDWERRFVLVEDTVPDTEVEEPAPRLATRVAGKYISGSGV